MTLKGRDLLITSNPAPGADFEHRTIFAGRARSVSLERRLQVRVDPEVRSHCTNCIAMQPTKNQINFFIPNRAAMSKKSDRLRHKAEELPTNADNIRAEECHRILLELAEIADELPISGMRST